MKTRGLSADGNQIEIRVCVDDTIGKANAQWFGRTEENQFGTVDGDGAPVRDMKNSSGKTETKTARVKVTTVGQRQK